MSSVRKSGSAPSIDANIMFWYPFRLKCLGNPDIHTLYAPSAQNRQDWRDKILEAKIRYSKSFLENSEPFRLGVMADCAFVYDVMSSPTASVVSVKDTPLDRALREIEQIHGSGMGLRPIYRSEINCATTFSSSGVSLVAMGTDDGVYISESDKPRAWARGMQINRVTQIAILEQFSLCLVIADKSLMAYHLDSIVRDIHPSALNAGLSSHAPQKLSGAREVSFFAIGRMNSRTLIFYKRREGLHSTYKILEPVFQKASETKPRSFFGRKFGAGEAEFFKEVDEFYIPAESFTINLFNESIAISTWRGFELLTLARKIPTIIPDPENPAIASIVARLVGEKPLDMFRLSNGEFLLCYEGVSVYVDKHAEVSRSVMMEHVCKANTAVLYGVYLVLFHSDFVEVRNAEDGTLRQIIAGEDVRVLDSGINPADYSTAMIIGDLSSVSMQRKGIKFRMAHPEVAGSQLVLEMILDEGHFREAVQEQRH